MRISLFCDCHRRVMYIECFVHKKYESVINQIFHQFLLLLDFNHTHQNLKTVADCVYIYCTFWNNAMRYDVEWKERKWIELRSFILFILLLCQQFLGTQNSGFVIIHTVLRSDTYALRQKLCIYQLNKFPEKKINKDYISIFPFEKIDDQYLFMENICLQHSQKSSIVTTNSIHKKIPIIYKTPSSKKLKNFKPRSSAIRKNVYIQRSERLPLTEIISLLAKTSIPTIIYSQKHYILLLLRKAH